MQKLQHWSMGLVVSMTSLSLSSAAIALPATPDYFCFQQQVTGRVQDLTVICQPSQAETTDQRAGTPSQKNATPTEGSPGKPGGGKKLVAVEGRAKRVLEFSDLNYEGGVFVGFAKNKTGKPIGRVSINYVVLKRESPTKWKPIYSGSTRTQANSLSAGEKTTFTATPDLNGDKIVITKAEF